MVPATQRSRSCALASSSTHGACDTGKLGDMRTTFSTVSRCAELNWSAMVLELRREKDGSASSLAKTMSAWMLWPYHLVACVRRLRTRLQDGALPNHAEAVFEPNELRFVVLKVSRRTVRVTGEILGRGRKRWRSPPPPPASHRLLAGTRHARTHYAHTH